MRKLTVPHRVGRITAALGLALASVSLVACGEKPQEQNQASMAPVVRPALTELVSARRADTLSFNGVVRASERADLSFRVGGLLNELLVNEGDQVKAGQVLARLDARDAQSALASVTLELKNIELEYQRAKAIYEKSQAISKSQLDDITTRYNVAKNRHAEALRQRDYTEITAPFAGIIGRRFVDNYVQMQANAPVFTLHDLSDLEVVIHVPDSVMLSSVQASKAQASISALAEQRFDLSLRSYSTQADPVSQAYAVVLGFDDLKGVRVLPGMAAKVFPSDESDATANAIITLPVIAVVPDNQGKQYVWLVGSDNKVTKRYVEVGTLSRDRVEITRHLELGEQVVVAGMSSLSEGMEIRPMLATSEAQ